MSRRGVIKERMEYAFFWLALHMVQALPRPLARHLSVGLAHLILWLNPKKLKTAQINFKLAFPTWTEKQKQAIMRRVTRQMGWLIAEFFHFPKYHKENITQIVSLNGLEHYTNVLNQGKGVLLLTAHISAFELLPVALALHGYPIHYLFRPIENSLINAKVNHYRSLAGSHPIEKRQSAHKILSILNKGETLGLLIDQNTLPKEGVFVDFFGHAACTTTGLARLALSTQAKVVPVFLLWDEVLGKYQVQFHPAVDIIRTGNKSFDIKENTQKFTTIIENCIRRYPDQWNWIHRRWKSRPPGEDSLY